ncbi:Fur family transcriptional regulator [Corynebacterium pelargi]|uniref:Zinc uptake regulation protein n=1 Tax=Corynebacterium pelargi TaxID=1471400 RepID=A0A410W7C8_9CORY|nr:Fur family transcriptional regulator [Corynebacterium pelargi]QAU51908.1 Zinc uptake regulation protein [Corynebacterium pelargi]GGG71532.1 transcriptional repressor [Corynebacterium pelargi]
MSPVVDPNVPKLGVRNTRQRSAVVQVLQELDTFASAKVIHREITDRDLKVGLTTVYRTLQSLAEIEAVDVLQMSNGETLYRHCSSDAHHHHLVCMRCGKTEEIEGGPVEQWAKDIAEKHGYQITGHDAEIYGLCKPCSEKES